VNIKVDDIMVPLVMTTTPHRSIGHVREVMSEHRVSCIPVVDSEEEPVGIVTSTDLLGDFPDSKPVGQVMSDKVLTVPRYADPSLAARIMRNHHVHHLVVTHEKKLVGIVSSFDLLQLVEDHRFAMKNAPTNNKHPHGRRKKKEMSDPS
jgi:CBS domain-containing protein